VVEWISYEVQGIDLNYFCFVLFSFVLISLVLFMLALIDGLKEIKTHFSLRQYVIYILGNLFILSSFPLSHFIFLHGRLWLAVAVIILFNGAAPYFFYKSSQIISNGKR